MNVLTVLGTRPEAIKLAPVIQAMRAQPDRFACRVCATAQHREMLDPVLRWFGIVPDYDLDLMEANQGLARYASRALDAVDGIVEAAGAELVIVQGDTTTALAAALAAFYRRIPVGHVEAGLRTGDLARPFPEEMNRRVTGILSTYHFAPTARAAKALRREGVAESRIFTTGNTVVDALLWTLARPVAFDLDIPLDGPRLLLVTAHRRESFGGPFEAICLALRDLAERNPDVRIVYPVHLNPRVREPVTRLLSAVPRISLLPPLAYEVFAHLLARAHLVLTDSGGIQEEAPSLGKPVLVMRETTERPEAVEAGAAMLVGTDRRRIVAETERLLGDAAAYRRMATVRNPYGDGRAAERIAAFLGKLSRGVFR